MDKKRVLIVEDDSNLRLLLQATLRQLDVDVISAENGAVGLEMFFEHSPNVVLLDLRMPVMDGFQFLEELNPKLDDPYSVIVLTGCDNNEDIQKSFQLGAHIFISKPFNITQVQEAVKQTIKLKDLEFKRRQMEEKINRLNEELEKKVVERTKSLEKIIEEQKVADEKIRTSEAHLKAIFNNTSQAFLLVDENYEVVSLNKITVDRAIGLYGRGIKECDNVLDFVDEDDMENFKDSFAKALAGENICFEKNINLSETTTLWFELNFSPIHDDKLSSPCVFIVINDVTVRKQAEEKLLRINEELERKVEERTRDLREEMAERKRKEEERAEMEIQLRQAQKLESIGQLASGIAHEINTPTQFVGDNTQFLKESFEDICRLLKLYEEYMNASAEEQADLRDEIKDTAEEIDLEFLLTEIPEAINQSIGGIKRVSEIVKAMKEFSHPVTEQKRMVDINKSVSSTVIVSRNEWKYVSDVESKLADDLPLVPCYPGELNQVILNVIVNAAHAIGDMVGQSGNKGKINVSTRKTQDGMVEIRIADNGPGISEENKPKIFDPFFTTKDIGKGTGQGLAIAYNIIVKKHHGVIDFESEEGKGTTFFIRLPAQNNEGNEK